MALAFLVWRPDLPLLYVTLLLCVVGTAIGLVYPVTTVSIQNAVPHHQVGVAMGALNFFRSLAIGLRGGGDGRDPARRAWRDARAAARRRWWRSA